jgi:hypothetical protein
MTHEGFEERLREAARDYHTPPATPREEMWAAIAARRAAPPAWRVSPWLRWGVGIAAVLLLGIGIGRLTVPARGRAPLGGAVAEAGNGDGPYRTAATQYLSRTEAFLTGFRADAGTGQLESGFGASARELLTATRLLLDSPAGHDARLRALLEDLELVLAQIARYESGDDVQFIDQGLDQRGVLLRLRAEIPAGAGLSAPEQGAL